MANSRHALVFAAILAFAAIVVMLAASRLIPLPLLLGGVVAVGVGAWVAPELVEFKDYERGVVFRFGRFHRLLTAGWHWVFPRFESFERVDLRTQAIDMPPQDAITSDNVKLSVDAIAFYRVKDPLKLVLEVKDPKPKLAQVIVSQLRVAVGRQGWEQAIVSTDQLNEELSKALANVASQWGLQVTRVEVQQIVLPPVLAQAMGKRQAAYEYKVKVETEALARQVALETVDKAASRLSDRTLAYLYLDSLKELAHGKSNKIIFPLELSKLAHLVGNRLGGESTPDLGALVKLLGERESGPARAKPLGLPLPMPPAPAAPAAHPLREVSLAGRAG
jgi:regulator of protease activity HflC (stomatin/prohibitin superfamily)